jgi:hypothetical protein
LTLRKPARFSKLDRKGGHAPGQRNLISVSTQSLDRDPSGILDRNLTANKGLQSAQHFVMTAPVLVCVGETGARLATLAIDRFEIGLRLSTVAFEFGGDKRWDTKKPLRLTKAPHGLMISTSAAVQLLDPVLHVCKAPGGALVVFLTAA